MGVVIERMSQRGELVMLVIVSCHGGIYDRDGERDLMEIACVTPNNKWIFGNDTSRIWTSQHSDQVIISKDSSWALRFCEYVTVQVFD